MIMMNTKLASSLLVYQCTFCGFSKKELKKRHVTEMTVVRTQDPTVVGVTSPWPVTTNRLSLPLIIIGRRIFTINIMHLSLYVDKKILR